jgi:carbonic anhydrase
MTTETDGQGLDLDIKDAIEGYERFRQAFERDRSFFKSLATKKQKPRLLWIGCCDSRVIPSQITSADPGELFEIRNIANCVPPQGAADDTVGAAIDYAVGHLGVDDIVVCGHTGCGGIQALAGPALPAHEVHLTRWIEYTRPAHRLVAAAKVPEDQISDATTKAHIQFQLDNLMTYEVVARGVAEGRVGIHGWLYDMEKGEILAYDRQTGTWRGLLETVGAG